MKAFSSGEMRGEARAMSCITFSYPLTLYLLYGLAVLVGSWILNQFEHFQKQNQDELIDYCLSAFIHWMTVGLNVIALLLGSFCIH